VNNYPSWIVSFSNWVERKHVKNLQSAKTPVAGSPLTAISAGPREKKSREKIFVTLDQPDPHHAFNLGHTHKHKYKRTVNWSLGCHYGHAESANAKVRSSVKRSANGEGLCAKCLHVSD